MSAFDENKFREKFKQRDTSQEGRISKQALADIIREFYPDIYLNTLQDIVQGFFLKSQNRAPKISDIIPPKNQEVKVDKVEGEEQEQEYEQNSDEEYIEPDSGEDYKITVEEGIRCVKLYLNRIHQQIWKLTSTIYAFQYLLSSKTKGKVFPLKDPAHSAKLNIIVGKQLQKYKSHFTFKVNKNASQTSSHDQPIKFLLKLSTPNKQVSLVVKQCWNKIYSTYLDFMGEEVPYAVEFIKSLDITAQATDTHFLLNISTKDSEIIEFVRAICQVGDNILKTPIKLNLQASIDFDFDLGDFITNPLANFYDFFSQSVRFRFKFKGSEYVTALKEVMIANQAFSGLSYVADDQFCLQLICLVSIQDFDLTLRFKNDFQHEKQQSILRAILMILAESMQGLNQYQQQLPQAIQLIKQLMKGKLQISIKAQDITAQLSLHIQNLQKVLFQTSVLLSQQEGQMGSQDNNQGANQYG